MKKNIVFIPVYNCENQIERVIEDIQQNKNYFFEEILIVDNISQDKTLKKAINSENLIDKKIKFTIIQNNNNINLGGSHKVALQYAQKNNYEYMIVLHGDNQALFSDLNSYFISGEYRKYDCILGSRFMKGSKLINYSKIRTAGNILFNFIFSLLVGKKISDLGSGLNVFSVNKFLDNKVFNMPNDLTFNYYLILYLTYNNFKYKFFPISWIEKDQLSNVRAFSQIVKMIKIIYKFSLLRNNFFKSKKLQELGYKVILKR